jgi:DNA primase
MITKNTIQNIIDQAKIEEVVGEFVALKKRGSSLLGLCPFHNEKTPSFNVSVSRNIYKCFGCGKGGNSINFLMEAQQLSYVEALKYLAQKYNVTIEEDYVSEEQRKDDEIKHSMQESILIANAFAQRYYTSYMLETDEGKIGLAYFKERGFSNATIEKFQLGFAPDGMRTFSDHAVASGYQIDILEKAGLASIRENYHLDFFRNRAMIPIHNLMGKVIAFGGRILKKDEKSPKYINTPESEVYVKSKIVYGIFQAKNSIRKKDECYLVEGYTDVISLAQNEIENVVASSGTSLTHDQIRLIKRFTNNITMLYDGDNAGIKAALRGTDLILEEGMNVRVVIFPDSEDPDSYVKKVGITAFEEFIEKNKKDLILFKTSLFAAETKDDPIKKAELIKDIVSSIAKIPDSIQRSVYIKSCSQMMDMEEQILIVEVNKERRKKVEQERRAVSNDTQEINETIAQEVERQANSQEPIIGVDSLAYYERDIVRIMLESGDKMLTIDEEDISVVKFMLEELHDEPFETSYKYVLEFLKNQEKPLSASDYLQHIDPQVSHVAFEVLTSPHELSPGWHQKFQVIVPDKEMTLPKDIESAVLRFKQFKNFEEIKKAEKILSEEQDFEAQFELLKKLKMLNEQRKQLCNESGTVIYRPHTKS